AHPTVVGIFHHARTQNYVKPVDEKVVHEIVIPLGMEYPETSASTAVDSHAGETQKLRNINRTQEKAKHRVIGKEAKRQTDWRDLDGVVVDVEVTDWPSATRNPRGRVVEILGKDSDFGVDVEIIIRKFHLPHLF